MCADSCVGIDVELSFIPKGPSVDEMSKASGKSLEDLLLGWGGEYELLFTADPEGLEKLYDSEIEFHIIGMVNDSGAPFLLKDGKRSRIPFGEYR